MNSCLKRIILILIIAIDFYGCSNINFSQITVTDKAGEGHTAVNKKGNTFIRPFSLNEQKYVDSLAFYSEYFELQYINGNQLRQIFHPDQLTWVAVWATWSEEALEQMRGYQLKAQRMNVELVMICSGSDRNTIARKLNEINFSGIAYVLDPKAYPGMEISRIIGFRKDIYPDCPRSVFEMPHHYIFENDKLVYFTEGLLKTNSIQELMK